MASKKIAKTCQEPNLFERIKLHIIIKKYIKYTESNEYYATLFAKKRIKQANSKTLINIISFHAPSNYDPESLQFQSVVCEIFPRTLKPELPQKSHFSLQEDCELACDAIKWWTDKKDIRGQKKNGVKGERFEIEGELREKKRKKPPMFVDDAPDAIKALEYDPKRKKNKLWSKAILYLNPDYLGYNKWTYKVIEVRHVA